MLEVLNDINKPFREELERQRTVEYEEDMERQGFVKNEAGKWSIGRIWTEIN